MVRGRCVVWMIGALLAGAAARAEAQMTAVTHIVGRITDPTGRALVNANVRQLGTAAFAAVDTSGRYHLRAVGTGYAKLRAAFIGYRPVERDSVRLSPGDTLHFDFALPRNVYVDIQEYTVPLSAPGMGSRQVPRTPRR